MDWMRHCGKLNQAYRQEKYNFNMRDSSCERNLFQKHLIKFVHEGNQFASPIKQTTKQTILNK